MQRLRFAICSLLLLCNLVAGQVPQTTSKFVKVVRNSAGRVVTGLDVELWQDGGFVYQLTENPSNPGEYYHNSVAHGLYDLYINGILKVGNIYHGAKKITNVIDRFTVTGDTVTVAGYVQAAKFIGDGSELTGIVGSIVEASDDLELALDTNADGIGDFKIIKADTIRAGMKVSSIHNQMNFVFGNANNRGLAGWDLTAVSSGSMQPALQFHSDTSGFVNVVRPYWFTSPNAARYAYMGVNDFTNEVTFGSTYSGNPPGTDLFPIGIYMGSSRAITIGTDSKIGLQVASPVSLFQLHQSANYTNDYGLKITTTNTGSDLGDGFDGFFDSSNNFYLSNRETGYISISTDGTERMRIGSTGIGLGSNAPVSTFHLQQGANYTNDYGFKITSTNTGDALGDGLDGFYDSSNNFYLSQREAGLFSIYNNGAQKIQFNLTGSTFIRDTTRVDKLRVGTSTTPGYVLTGDADGNFTPQSIGTASAGGWEKATSTRIQPIVATDTTLIRRLRIGTTSTANYVPIMDANGNAVPGSIATLDAAGWTKATSTRIEPKTLTDTTRINNLRFKASGTSGNALIIDSNGNVSANSEPTIGDTIEVSVMLDTTASNSGSGNAADFLRLGVRRSLTFWTLDATNSDTLLASLPIPDYVSSLDYVMLPARANANSGNYFMSLSWEFFAHDDALDNSLTYTNNTTFSVAAPGTSGDWILYRKTLSSSATGSNRWLDLMLIRVGGNGSDTASGNLDLSTEIIIGFTRVRGY